MNFIFMGYPLEFTNSILKQALDTKLESILSCPVKNRDLR